MSITFSSLALSEPLIRALSELGFTEPFPIQSAAIPHGLAGRDIQCQAPTGSGKTLAFGLPLLTNVTQAKPGRPRALILAPTRELAEQIRRDLDPLARVVGRQVAAVYGGVGYREQKRALQRGVDVLVATPGRLEDLMDQRCVDLADVDIVTIDEADRMADMGFLPAVRRILATTRQERQTLLFSATLDGDVAVLAGKSQKDPVKVLADVSDDLELDLVHRFWRVDRSERLSHAVDVINTFERTIVFTRTRHGADRLARQLVKSGVPTVAMHGGRSQNQRTRALQAFSMGKARALVATDVAARGIHVDDVDVVLHYDLANDHKDYLHRSGRTGRAGASGTVISLVIGGQEKDVKKIQHAAGIDSRLDAPGRLEPARKRVSPPGRADLDVRSDRSPNTQQRAEKLRIYVGNLPWRVSDADLGSLFAEHGQVDRAVIATNRKSGRSKGYGLVDMPSGPAKRAISQLDGTLLDGRALRVRAAR